MLKRWIYTVLLLALLPIAGASQAQSDEEPTPPEIPYYRSSSSFNVPILELDGWDVENTREDALYSNAALNARLYVTAVKTTDDSEAIQAAVAAVYDGDLPEARHESRIGLSNGTWTQRLFSIDETSISTLALVRRDRTFVVTLIEDSPDYSAYQLAVRTPPSETTNDDGTPRPDFEAGVDTALSTFLGEDNDFVLDDSTDLTALGADSMLNRYTVGDEEFALFALDFDFITYATFADDTNTAQQLGEAFNTVFLGFFITPDNSNFLYLALAVVATIYVALIGSMWLRYRNVRKDMALVEELASKE